MKKILLFFIVFNMVISLAKTQTTSVDFTLTDCDSNVISLYNILDQKKIVILFYEHLCFPCTQGADSVKLVINKFYHDSTNIKIIYLDNGGNTCTDVRKWLADSGFISGPIIQYSNDYSTPYGDGMPVIVITAGLSHKIFMTKLAPGGDDTSSIHQAIKNAYIEISSSGIESIPGSSGGFEIYPNPVPSAILTLFATDIIKDVSSVEIFDISGNKLFQILKSDLNSKSSKIEIPVSFLNNGLYFLNIKSLNKSVIKKFVINR
jgi:hypothetical protein